jgi:prepilin-type N-terminal cleavage/methylation domain-containing protein
MMSREDSVEAYRNRIKARKKANGFSLLELLVAVTILVIVAGAVMVGMINTTRSQSTVMNRTQLHASVRNATELMEQEIGQAGRVVSSPGLKIGAVATTGLASTVNVTTTSSTLTATNGLYAGEQLVVDPSSTNEETVTIASVPSSTSITATFANTHSANTPVLILGGFASGIVPPDTSSMYVFSGTGTTKTTLSSGPTGQASTSSILKLYGDINGDGTMYYVVYKCSPNSSGTGTLYRYVSTDITTATTVSAGTLLLDNLATNPVDSNGNVTPCFTYQTKDVAVTINGGQVIQSFVVNVAVTLTIQTENRDAKTNQFQQETKALLNISPRNIFDAWELASAPAGYTRAQPMPDNILNGSGGSSLLTATLTP